VTPPDVLYRRSDGRLYDETRRAWDARNLRPLAPEPAAEPLTHASGCRLTEWPDLADVCTCTAQQRYQHRRTNH
jgi:hypothetical protein